MGAILSGGLPFNSFNERARTIRDIKDEFQGKVKIHYSDGPSGIVYFEQYTSYEKNISH